MRSQPHTQGYLSHAQDTCRPDVPNPGGRVAAWTMSETTGGDHEGQASPSEEGSTQNNPEPASEPEVIEVAPGKTVAVITLKLVYKINWKTQHVYNVPAETTKAVDDFFVPKHYRREEAREASLMYSLGAMDFLFEDFG